MRILIATDAWRPQVNGVVPTLERMTQAAARVRREVRLPDPAGHVDRADADLSRHPAGASPRSAGIGRRIEEAAPDHIHIATEGPIGWLTRRYCLRRKRLFTTSYHTRFPEYIAARIGIPERLTYAGCAISMRRPRR